MWEYLFSKALIARIFKNITDEQIVKLAEEHVRNELKEALHMLGRRYNIQSFLDAVCSWCEASAFPYRYDEADHSDIYTIRFDMGEKGSTFFGKFLQLIAENMNTKITTYR
jgi:hypothetical protein